MRREITLAIRDGYTHFISGFAEGADLLFPSIVAELKSEYPLTLEAAIPYRNRIKKADETFQNLISCYNVVVVHSEQYSPSCFMKRNRFMVQASSCVIAVYDGRCKGGTFATINYAHMTDKVVRIIKF